LWDEGALITEIERRFGAVEARVARRLFEWARSVGAVLEWGRGTQSGSAFINPAGAARRVWPFAIWTYGKIEVQFQGLARVPEFEAEERRRELQRRLNRIPGVAVADDALTKRPSFSLALLDTDAAFEEFTGAMGWAASVVANT
jgi:hypothetical protein